MFWALAVARANHDRAYYALLLKQVTRKYAEAEMQVAEFSKQVSYVDFILV